MGVGDLAVPSKMRRFGEAFYGRQAAYGRLLPRPTSGNLRRRSHAISSGLPDADDAGGAACALCARGGSATGRRDGRRRCWPARLVFPSPEALCMPERRQECTGALATFRWRSRTWRRTAANTSISLPTRQTRAAVAQVAGLRDLPRLQANFEVTRTGTPVCASPEGLGDRRPDLRRHARANRQ